MRALSVYLRLEFGSNGRWIFQIFCEVLHKIRGFSFYTHTWYYTHSYLWLNDSWNFLLSHPKKWHIELRISCIYKKRLFCKTTYGCQGLYWKCCLDSPLCLNFSTFFFFTFFLNDCVFMCIHLLFSNLGDKSISSSFLCCGKKGKTANCLKKKSSIFLVKEWFFIDYGSLTYNHRKISSTPELWEKSQFKCVHSAGDLQARCGQMWD